MSEKDETWTPLLAAIQRFGFACLDLGSLPKGSNEYRDAMREMVQAWGEILKLTPERHADA